MQTNAISNERSAADRIAGRIATGGLGLVLGSLLFTGFMFYLYCTAQHVLRGGVYGPVIWGIDAYQIAMHGLLLPLAIGIAGVFVPLGRIRSALSRVLWALVLVAAGVSSFAVCWAWTIFVMFCWFMANPG